MLYTGARWHRGRSKKALLGMNYGTKLAHTPTQAGTADVSSAVDGATAGANVAASPSEDTTQIITRQGTTVSI
jgi:hypothetical protein